jgi:4-aminobutyrate aminotransferase-like enzyme
LSWTSRAETVRSRYIAKEHGILCGDVVRILVPLTIEDAVLEEGLGMMEQALVAS